MSHYDLIGPVERNERKIKLVQGKKRGLSIPPGTTFIYIGRPRGGAREHQGVVTVAMLSPAPGILHLGFSFCSPSDPWCKITGRDLAIARLINPIMVPCLYSPRQIALEVARAVMMHDFELLRVGLRMPFLTNVPSWTKKLVKKLKGQRARRPRKKPLSHPHPFLCRPTERKPTDDFFSRLRKRLTESYHPDGRSEPILATADIMLGMLNDILSLQIKNEE